MARILVVDDDPDILELISLVLRRSGHEITLASDGVGALEQAERTHPDLVLLDWMMPCLEGTEVCVRLRARVEFADTIIMLMTARAQQEDRERGYLVGADDYVTKPFSPAALRSDVDAALARRGIGPAS